MIIMSTELSESELYKWRCLVALAHADGKLTLEEMNMLKLQFRKRKFPPAALNQLNNDLAVAQDFEPLYHKVTERKDREELLNLAHTLFWSDSDFHEAEERLYEYIKGSLHD